MRVAALQMNSGTEPGPNLDALEAFAHEAAGQGATYALSPEVTVIYPENRDHLRGESTKILEAGKRARKA